MRRYNRFGGPGGCEVLDSRISPSTVTVSVLPPAASERRDAVACDDTPSDPEPPPESDPPIEYPPVPPSGPGGPGA